MSSVQVIADMTRRMGAGMAKYIQQHVESIAEYDEYCQFVAGLVGIGLSQASTMSPHFVLEVLLVDHACCASTCTSTLHRACLATWHTSHTCFKAWHNSHEMQPVGTISHGATPFSRPRLLHFSNY